VSELRIALDFTPAVSQAAGVGRYTRDLVEAMLEVDHGANRWLLWYPKGADESNARRLIPVAARERVSLVEIPIRERWLNIAWHRLRLPARIERFTGPASVVHGTDFLVPPSRAASIATIHDLSFEIVPQFAHPKLRSYLSRAVPATLKRAAHVIAVSETTKRDIIDRYDVRPEKITVIHHGASAFDNARGAALAVAATVQFGLRPPYFLSVGTVEPRKNHFTLLKAFRRVRESHPECSLVIAGRAGWLADDILREIERAMRDSRVIHLQGVSDAALRGLYAGSVALVYPSWYEGFGLPVLEAMSAGVPVISSDAPALVEVAGDAALTAPAGDADQLAALMCQLLDEPSTRDLLIARGRVRAAGFSWQLAARQHLNLYRSVAATGKVGGK
jgi:glycosyltransferase involved in cell wall biosynthesis